MKSAIILKGNKGNKHQPTKQKIGGFYICFLQLGKESNTIMSTQKETILYGREIDKYSRSHFYNSGSGMITDPPNA